MLGLVDEFIDNYKEKLLEEKKYEAFNLFLIEGLCIVDDVFEQAAFYSAFKNRGLTKYIEREKIQNSLLPFIDKIEKLHELIDECESSHMKFLEFALTHLKKKKEEEEEEKEKDLTDEDVVQVLKAFEEMVSILYGCFLSPNFKELLDFLEKLKKEQPDIYKTHTMLIGRHIEENTGHSVDVDELIKQLSA